jgi:hypothetical protein
MIPVGRKGRKRRRIGEALLSRRASPNPSPRTSGLCRNFMDVYREKIPRCEARAWEPDIEGFSALGY